MELNPAVLQDPCLIGREKFITLIARYDHHLNYSILQRDWL